MSVEVVGDHISRSSPGGKSSDTTSFAGATYTECWSSAICGSHDGSIACLPACLPASSLRVQSRDDDDVLDGSLIPVTAGNNHLTTVRRRACPGCKAPTLQPAAVTRC